MYIFWVCEVWVCEGRYTYPMVYIIVYYKLVMTGSSTGTPPTVLPCRCSPLSSKQSAAARRRHSWPQVTPSDPHTGLRLSFFGHLLVVRQSGGDLGGAGAGEEEAQSTTLLRTVWHKPQSLGICSYFSFRTFGYETELLFCVRLLSLLWFVYQWQ